MPKYRRIRRYRRKSGRWAPSIVKISSQNQADPGEWFNYETLAENPIQVSSGVAQVFTVKNFEITFTIEVGSFTDLAGNNLESITAYIMYVPQGMNITSNYFLEHPEYIMNYRYLGSPSTPGAVSSGGSTYVRENQQYQPFKMKTRLSRKLQTGDKVILFIQGSNSTTSSKNYNIDGIVRWWSKAN